MADTKITNYRKLKEAEAILQADISYHKNAMQSEFATARTTSGWFPFAFKTISHFAKAGSPESKNAIQKLLQPILIFVTAKIIERVTPKQSWINFGTAIVSQIFSVYKSSISSLIQRAFHRKHSQEEQDA